MAFSRWTFVKCHKLHQAHLSGLSVETFPNTLPLFSDKDLKTNLMKAVNIRFFSPTENSDPKTEAPKALKLPKVVLIGYISPAGKLVLPHKTAANLGIDLDETPFKIGMDQGKRKAKSLYLVPTTSDQESFSFEKAAKSYTLALPLILKKSGVDYATAKYSFTIRLFEHEGTTAFELQLTPETAISKKPYTGKPRGRKPKVNQAKE